MHEEKKGVALPYREVLLKADMMMRVHRSVPVNLWREVMKPREPVEIKPGVSQEWTYTSYKDTWSTRRGGLQGGVRYDRYGVEEPVRGDGASTDGRRGVKPKTGGVDPGETDALASKSIRSEVV